MRDTHDLAQRLREKAASHRELIADDDWPQLIVDCGYDPVESGLLDAVREAATQANLALDLEAAADLIERMDDRESDFASFREHHSATEDELKQLKGRSCETCRQQYLRSTAPVCGVRGRYDIPCADLGNLCGRWAPRREGQ